MSPVNLLHIFTAPFSRNTSGWLLLKIYQVFHIWRFIFNNSEKKLYKEFPVDTGRKLNVHRTLRRRPRNSTYRRLLNVPCTFSLHPVSTGLYSYKESLLDDYIVHITFRLIHGARQSWLNDQLNYYKIHLYISFWK